MSNAESEFRLLLTGETLPGFERESVVDGLSRLLKVSQQEARGLLCGERSRIRKKLSLEKAERLRDKLLARGAGCELEVIAARAANEEPAVRSTEGPEQDSVQDSPVDAGFSGLTLELDEPLPGAPEDDERERPVAEASAGQEEIVLESRPLPEGADEGMDVTRPMPAVDLSADQRPESREQDSGVAQFYAAPVARRAEKSGKAPEQGRHKLLLLLGLLLVLVVAGGFFYLSSNGVKKPRLEKQAPAVVAPVVTGPKARTERRLEDLVRQVRLWMIQYGAGFDPSQVTLERLVEDLKLPLQMLKDEWGGPIDYQVDGDLYRLVSPGADGKPGTGDDLLRQARAR